MWKYIKRICVDDYLCLYHITDTTLKALHIMLRTTQRASFFIVILCWGCCRIIILFIIIFLVCLIIYHFLSPAHRAVTWQKTNDVKIAYSIIAKLSLIQSLQVLIFLLLHDHQYNINNIIIFVRLLKNVVITHKSNIKITINKNSYIDKTFYHI